MLLARSPTRRLGLAKPREAVEGYTRSQDHGSDAGNDLGDGKKALLHLAPGTKEDTASYREFFQDLRSNRQLHSR